MAEPVSAADHSQLRIGYGNSVGVPTVGGEVVFDDCYRENPLVNVLCLGVLPTDRLVLGQASGVGNLAVLLGSSTGRDGIGGASVLASAEFSDEDMDKRPTVQIGDPFEESKLLECCQELLQKDLLVSLQDLGAAGLTSSAGEMASAGGTGIDIDVGLVPLREEDMEPFEIMVSESQERMLAVVTPELVDEVMDVCRKWQTVPAVIGEITDSGDFVVLAVQRRGDDLGPDPVVLASGDTLLLQGTWAEYRDQFASWRIPRRVAIGTLIWDCRVGLVTTALAAFGRAISEVGAVMTVGGNIAGATRVMTTGIALETSKGDLPLALGLGIVLIAIVLAVNAAAQLVREWARVRYG